MNNHRNMILFVDLLLTDDEEKKRLIKENIELKKLNHQQKELILQLMEKIKQLNKENRK